MAGQQLAADVGPSAEREASSSARQDEILVTTRKREENLQEVPLAISALTGDEIEKAGIEHLADLANRTAGLEFASTGNVSGSRPIIRGLSQQTRVGDETNVASFIDGVYSPGFSGSTLPFEALERVEVVRGPQSASYGRNSFAGAINYISRKPTEDPDYGFRGTLGTDEKSGLYTYLSGPVIGSTLLGRLDLSYRNAGGTFRNSYDDEPLNSVESKLARVSLRSELEWITMDGSFTYSDDDYSPPARTNIPGTDPRRVGKPAGGGNPFETFAVQFEGADQTPPRFGRRTKGELTDEASVFLSDPRAGGERKGTFTTFRIEFDLDDYVIESLTGYQAREVLSISDVDRYDEGTPYGSALAANEVIGQPIYIQSVTGSREDRDEFSQDLRLSFDNGGPLSGSVGAYFSTEDFTDQRVRDGSDTLQAYSSTCPEEIFGSPSPASCLVTYVEPGGLALDSSSDLKNTFYSLYAGAQYDFLESWSLTLEGRYTWENKEANNTTDNYPSNSVPLGDLGKQRFDYFTPRINLSNQLTDNVLVYGLVAKGVKSGGYNAEAVREDEKIYDTESNWTYEVGGKLTLWDGRATLNAAAFYIDWSDQQITSTARDLVGELTTDPITANIGESEVKGVEFEATALPVDWLTLNLSYTYLDATYDDALFISSRGWVDCEEIGTIECIQIPDPDVPAVLITVSSGQARGNQLVNTSKHLFAGGAEVTLPTGYEDWDGFFRADYAWQDKRYVDSENIGWVPSRGIVNLRLGVKNSHWSVEGFCDNVGDDRTPITGFPPRDFVGVPSNEVANRTGRICGVTTGYRYR